MFLFSECAKLAVTAINFSSSMRRPFCSNCKQAGHFSKDCPLGRSAALRLEHNKYHSSGGGKSAAANHFVSAADGMFPSATARRAQPTQLPQPAAKSPNRFAALSETEERAARELTEPVQKFFDSFDNTFAAMRKREEAHVATAKGKKQEAAGVPRSQQRPRRALESSANVPARRVPAASSSSSHTHTHTPHLGQVMLCIDSGADKHLVLESQIVKERQPMNGTVKWGGGDVSHVRVCGYTTLTMTDCEDSSIQQHLELPAWGVQPNPRSGKSLVTPLISVPRLEEAGAIIHFENGNRYVDFSPLGGQKIRFAADSMVSGSIACTAAASTTHSASTTRAASARAAATAARRQARGSRRASPSARAPAVLTFSRRAGN